ncbi:MAG: AMP-binding protein [Pseudomonadota bacterium]
MTIDRWIAEADPDAPALGFEGERWSYGELAAWVEETARRLTAAGVGRGDRVAWYGMNRPEVFFLFFACARLGAVFVPLNWRLAAAEVAGVVDDCDPKLVVHDDRFAHPAQALRRPRRAVAPFAAEWPLGEASVGGGAAGDPLLIVYTSGSTGRPKGVVLTQEAVAANATMSVEAHGLTAASRALVLLPLFHVGGLNILSTPAFSIGASVELHEKFEPDAAVEALQRATHAILVPTVLAAMMAAPGWAEADLSGIDVLSIGSTDVPVEQIEAVHARGAPMIQIYGATETSPIAIHQTAAEARTTVGALGRAGSLCEIRLMRADGTEAATGEPGEIWAKGPNVLKEYWRNPEETARSLQDGWFRTGDVAVRGEDGLYRFADRIKHVVISGGENIYPAELERVLRPHPKIAEVAVVGQPDPKWGEIPVAVVVPRDRLRASEVLGAFNGALARYKHPKKVIFVDALPRNAMGKVVAAEVRAMISGEALAEA